MPKFSVNKTSEEWRAILGKDYNILRNKGTERAGTGEYNNFYPKAGHFACKGCKFPLYSATSKFEDCGWIAFDRCYHNGDVCHVGCENEYGQVEMHCNNLNSLSVQYVKGAPANAAALKEGPMTLPEDVKKAQNCTMC
ncbi:hypothetical protein CYMTET_9812 [Cymbomonas tetramitiformis]|uniref:MsrB domain-containing protein n=1 Tax=Cymbomonas tetramitiformis TaxID=36881 RepID=A0AAE0LES1_9CHLO|nr:hypothetical protein CYMTET_9812 [Cymbomonas tetramitiformis]